MNIRCALAAALFCAAPVTAFAAPSQLLNKTVTVSFTVSGLAQQAGEATPHSFSSVVSHTIYVSSAGRLFERHGANNGKGSKRRDVAPDSAGSGSFSFQGNRLVGVRSFSAGARQVVVNFDSGFSSCTANIIEGKENGVINRVGASGKRVTETQVKASSPNCSIQDGNAFAN